MQGFELVPSNLGGWSLDKHHAINLRSGECARVIHIGLRNVLFLLTFLSSDFFFFGAWRLAAFSKAQIDWTKLN